MRKKHIRPSFGNDDSESLDLEALAVVEVSSERPDYPIENAFNASAEHGWRAATGGSQTIRLLFDEPQSIGRIGLVFNEAKCERTQEFALSWLADGQQSFREILRQQWNFSPHGATFENENYDVKLTGVKALELRIQPSPFAPVSTACLRRRVSL